jgi:prepilin-type N-terminal cleavage/methylation domain-containing protein
MSQLKSRGFTLVELSIVMVIIALLASGLFMTLTAQIDNVAASETRRRLDDAREALLGYAAANGRLPCPAIGEATGHESPPGGGVCNDNWDGFLPAATLGLGPTDSNGYALDGWNNPIRYAVTKDESSQVTTSNQIKTSWNTASAMASDLRICSTATCATGAEITDKAIAVILSRGKNGSATPSSADEIENGDTDRLFVTHTPTPAGANEFDDMLIWISPNILYSKMIAAGRLP